MWANVSSYLRPDNARPRRAKLRGQPSRVQPCPHLDACWRLRSAFEVAPLNDLLSVVAGVAAATHLIRYASKGKSEALSEQPHLTVGSLGTRQQPRAAQTSLGVNGALLISTSIRKGKGKEGERWDGRKTTGRKTRGRQGIAGQPNGLMIGNCFLGGGRG